jgi:hypothetical protein
MIGHIRRFGVAVAIVVGLTNVISAAAADCTLFGDATKVKHGAEKHAVLLRSGFSPATFGGIDIGVPAGMAFSDLSELSTDWLFVEGSCGGGSPRFQVNVTTSSGQSGNVFVYIGPSPFGTGCPTDLEMNSGNLAQPGAPGDIPGTWDSSQIVAGTQVSTYSATLGLAIAGGWTITGIQLVVDAGWAFPPNGQAVIVDRVSVNNHACFPDKEKKEAS